jgi:hypothetical protein
MNPCVPSATRGLCCNVDVTYVPLYRLSGFALVEREVVETYNGLLVVLELIAHLESLSPYYLNYYSIIKFFLLDFLFSL